MSSSRCICWIWMSDVVVSLQVWMLAWDKTRRSWTHWLSTRASDQMSAYNVSSGFAGRFKSNLYFVFLFCLFVFCTLTLLVGIRKSIQSIPAGKNWLLQFPEIMGGPLADPDRPGRLGAYCVRVCFTHLLLLLLLNGYYRVVWNSSENPMHWLSGLQINCDCCLWLLVMLICWC